MPSHHCAIVNHIDDYLHKLKNLKVSLKAQSDVHHNGCTFAKLVRFTQWQCQLSANRTGQLIVDLPRAQSSLLCACT